METRGSEFKAGLGYIMNLRPAWDTQELLSKNTNKVQGNSWTNVYLIVKWEMVYQLTQTIG